MSTSNECPDQPAQSRRLFRPFVARHHKKCFHIKNMIAPCKGLGPEAFFDITPRPWCPPGWKGAVSLAKVYYITEIDIGSNSVPVLVDVLKGLYICRDLRLIIGMVPGESGDHHRVSDHRAWTCIWTRLNESSVYPRMVRRILIQGG